MDQLSHVAWLFQGGGNALYKKFFSDALKLNIEPFMVQPMGPDPLGWFKNPINSLEDMKKLKYRSPPGLVGEIFKEMGVNAVAMPGGEIVPAAQRGVLDAAEWIGPADDMALGFHNVFKHYYLQGLHQSHRRRRAADQQDGVEQAAGRPEGDRRGVGDGDDDRDLHLQRATATRRRWRS